MMLEPEELLRKLAELADVDPGWRTSDVDLLVQDSEALEQVQGLLFDHGYMVLHEMEDGSSIYRKASTSEEPPSYPTAPKLPTMPPRIAEVLERLLVWADDMGGWEAPVWDEARRVLAEARRVYPIATMVGGTPCCDGCGNPLDRLWESRDEAYDVDYGEDPEAPFALARWSGKTCDEGNDDFRFYCRSSSAVSDLCRQEYYAPPEFWEDMDWR